MSQRAVIFDLDGVIVDTAKFHFRAWKQIADSEGIYFDAKINELLKGVSRMESLEIIMKNKQRSYSEYELQQLATRKNDLYRQMLNTLCVADILPGIKALISDLKKQKIKAAICSASKNTDYIVEKLKIIQDFEAIVTGNHTSRSKPDPQGLLLACERLGVEPQNCIVIEDAVAGIQAACSANMKSVGIGDSTLLSKANLIYPATEYFNVDEILSLF